jgi:signal peptidase I
VTRTKLIETGLPKRGDVAVFKYPVDPLVDFIKRIVALPGDRVVYKDRHLYIKPSCDNTPDRCDKFYKVESKQLSVGDFEAYDMPLTRFEADMFGVNFEYLTNPRLRLNEDRYEPKQAGTAIGEWVVPPGHYFAMGDNRDNSQDSRFWGFVPEENLVGRAMFIWMSFEFGRDPDNWLLRKIPTDIRFERLGSF